MITISHELTWDAAHKQQNAAKCVPICNLNVVDMFDNVDPIENQSTLNART